jgi:hypothetical protein
MKNITTRQHDWQNKFSHNNSDGNPICYTTCKYCGLTSQCYSTDLEGNLDRDEFQEENENNCIERNKYVEDYKPIQQLSIKIKPRKTRAVKF